MKESSLADLHLQSSLLDLQLNVKLLCTGGWLLGHMFPKFDTKHTLYSNPEARVSDFRD